MKRTSKKRTVKAAFLALTFATVGSACGPSVIQGTSGDEVAGADAGATGDLVSLSITFEGKGQGTVLVDGEQCTEAPCLFELDRNSIVTLEAVPGASANFQGWSADCEGLLCEVTINEDEEVFAAFEPAGVIEQQRVHPEIARAADSVADSEGNTYYIGAFQEQAPPTLFTSGNLTGYIAKFSPAGEFIWATRFNMGLVFETRPTLIEFDPSGDIYVAGLGKEANADPITGGPDSHVFCSRINPTSGQILWTYRARGLALATQLKITAAGNVFLGGVMTYGNNLSFDNTVLLAVPGVYDVFTAMLSSTGAFMHATKQNPAESVVLKGALADPAGGTWISATTGEGLNTLQHYTETGVRDILRSIPAAGRMAWASDGDLIVAGRVRDRVDWGNGTITQPTNDDAFVAKMTLDGSIGWVNIVGGSGDQRFSKLQVDEGGNIFVGGYTQGSVNFGGEDLTAVGFGDAIVGSYSPTGAHRWSHLLGSTQDEGVQGMYRVGETLEVFVSVLPNTPIATELGTLTVPPGHLDTTNGYGCPAVFSYSK